MNTIKYFVFLIINSNRYYSASVRCYFIVAFLVLQNVNEVTKPVFILVFVIVHGNNTAFL